MLLWTLGCAYIFKLVGFFFRYISRIGIGSCGRIMFPDLRLYYKAIVIKIAQNRLINQWKRISKFSLSVMSDSLRPHWLQHSRLPCPSPTPRDISNSCPSSQWCHPTISSFVAPSPPAFNLSQHQGLFQWVSYLHQVAKIWSFSFSISPSNEYSGLISFRMDWFDLLAAQGTLKSFLWHHKLKASVL